MLITIILTIIGIILSILIYKKSNKWNNIEVEEFIENNKGSVYVKTKDKQLINKIKNKFSEDDVTIIEKSGRELVIIENNIWMKENNTKPISMKNSTKADFYKNKYL